ncbi:hypothetical protein SEA_KLEIN_200 [Mycobacterium phage Klein]|nr:hypothetical protein SEA_KLEIN_200 [Mycobacterium phage Klein]
MTYPNQPPIWEQPAWQQQTYHLDESARAAKRKGRIEGWLALGAIVALIVLMSISPGHALLVVFGTAYFVPTIVAYYRKASLKQPVAVINVFLGWTFIGWVVALAMAVK